MADRLDLSAVQANPLYDEMWAAVLAYCDELEKVTPNRGTRRGTALVGGDGWSVSSILGIYLNDGTTRIWEVSARYSPRRGVEASADGPWTDSRDAFWAEQLADRSCAVVIGGEHYRIRPDVPERDRDHAGFGGGLHRVRWLADGSVTETRNLWHQGTVPPLFRDRLPDTAEFIPAQSARNPESENADA